VQGGHRAGQGTPSVRWVAEYLLPLATARGREGAGRLRAQPARRWCLSTAAGARTRTRGRRSCPGGRMRRTRASPGDQLGSESSPCRCWPISFRRCLLLRVSGRAYWVPPRKRAHTAAAWWAAQRTQLLQPGNGNLQPGLGIIPTLFGLQHAPGATRAHCSRLASLAPAPPAHAAACNHGAGQGGFPEPLTPEQQHQVRCLAGPQAAASTRACDEAAAGAPAHAW